MSRDLDSPNSLLAPILTLGVGLESPLSSKILCSGSIYNIKNIGLALLQLAYMSTSTLDLTDVSILSRQAYRRNVAEEITGVLLHRNGHFLHVIEGPREHVEDLFLRLIRDNRHCNLHVLFRRVVDFREFSSLSMMTPKSDHDQNSVIERVRCLMTCEVHNIRMKFEYEFGQAA